MRRHGSGSKRTSVGRDVERKSSKLYGGCRTLKTATKVLRKVGAIAPLATLAVISGAAVVSLGERLDFGLLPLVVAVPAGLYALPAVLLAGLKIRKLFGQLKSWHLLWFMAFLSGLTFRIRGIEDIQENTLDSAVIHRVVLMGIVGLVLLGAFSLRRSPGVGNLFRGLIGWMTTYAIVNVLSTLWSVYPTWTFYKSVEYLTTVALIAAIVETVSRQTREFKVLFDWTWLLMGLMLVSVWIGVISNPEEAILRGVGLLDVQIQGIFPRVSANGVGDLGASIGIVSFVRLLYTKGEFRRFYSFIFVIGVVTLVVSQSRSPLTGFFLAISIILFLEKRNSALALGIVTVPLIVLLAPLADSFTSFFLRGQSKELFLSLSGRVYWWGFALPFLRENPFLGYGAYSAGRFLVAKEFGSTLSSLHNTWMEVLIGTGFVGMILLLVTVLKAWMILLKPPHKKREPEDVLARQLRFECIGLLSLLTIRSVFTVSFIWHPALAWFLIMGYAEFLRRGCANQAVCTSFRVSGGRCG